MHYINISGYDLCLGDLQENVNRTLDILNKQHFARRLRSKDVTVWKQDDDRDKVILNRLGWMDIIPTMMEKAFEIKDFAAEVQQAGFKHAVLMGMGGSSLSPEVSRLTFGVKEGCPDLMVLDSAVPESVKAIEDAINPEETLFIVSTKSGTTVETLSAYNYFFAKVRSTKGDSAGENFIAITDPGTPLEIEAKSMKFRRLFLNFQDIGGRYSALSYFGLVPIAVIGVDIDLLLQRAKDFADQCAADTEPAENPGVVLGTILAQAALLGKDKMTLVLSPEIYSFGYWVEQLVAESSGKNGAGILPVESEYLTSPENYVNDRLFVYVRLADSPKELDEKIEALADAGHPIVEIRLNDIYDIGAEYYRWEIATAVSCALLGVNPFDEPNVKESKDNTNSVLAYFAENGKLPAETPIVSQNGISLFCDAKLKGLLDQINGKTGGGIESYIKAFLDLYQPGNYFAVMAYVYPSKEVDGILQCMRAQIRDKYLAATTLGYGPRYLHSTGQYHKGAANNGLFLQITAEDPEDVPIPGQNYSFSILKQAQAIGDADVLAGKGRPFFRIHLEGDVEEKLNELLQLIHGIAE